MTKTRPCKLCIEKRWGNSSWCRLHHFERLNYRRQETKARRLERKMKTKKYQTSELKSWKKKTWKLMSEWVRRKDADKDGFNACYTCNVRKHWKELQGGHRHHRRLDYDERNIHQQCGHCNQTGGGGLNGNLGEYERRLIQENGLEWSAKLRLDANTAPPYTLDQVKQIHALLEAKLALLP